MAIGADMLPALEILLAPAQRGGRIMTFGRQTIRQLPHPDQESLFGSLGFDEVHSLDASPFEGCTHLHDLNLPTIPPDLVGRYRVVFTGGTIEHVFELTNALRTAAALVEPGGLLIHAGPANNLVDHGFYQLSPTLLFDWFLANGWELQHSLARLSLPRSQSSVTAVLPPGEGAALGTTRGFALHFVSARRLPGSTIDRTPLQSYYVERHGSGTAPRHRLRAVAPYGFEGGKVRPAALTRFALDDLSPWESGGYAVPFQRDGFAPSLDTRPFRSRALVYEDGRLLDWMVSAPALVGETPGSFTHFGRRIHLSASDGSDPRGNGRRYEVAFPSSDPLKPAAAQTA